jgi:Protein of unknown function (DUF4446)
MAATLSVDTLPAVSSVELAAIGCGILALLLALHAHWRLRRMRRHYSVLQGGYDQPQSFVAVVARKVAEVERLRAEIASVRDDIVSTRAALAEALQHVSVVRYDAFGDQSGRLSFSAALLDDLGDGLVLSAINGRAETRLYAKGVKDGRSAQSLSPEEEQAVSYALRRAVAYRP